MAAVVAMVEKEPFENKKKIEGGVGENFWGRLRRHSYAADEVSESVRCFNGCKTLGKRSVGSVFLQGGPAGHI